MNAIAQRLPTEELTHEPLLSMVRRRGPVQAGPLASITRLLPWIVGAVSAGVLVGFIATSLVPLNHRSVQHWARAERGKPDQTVVSVTYLPELANPPLSRLPSRKQTTSLQESKNSTALEEVKIRNRRLEALVKVLRRRDATETFAHTSHKN